MENNKVINDICWIAYFDTLGFQNLLNFFEEKVGSYSLDVFARCYPSKIILNLERSVGAANDLSGRTTNVKVNCFWFSDSFGFFAPDDGSVDSFYRVKYASEEFFRNTCIGDGIPLRGALTNGAFYADKKKNIFFGTGLNDAYSFAEKQDWIGFVLTPAAYKKLGERIADLKKCLKDYKEYAVPIKKQIKDGIKQIVETRKNLFAFHFHRQFSPNGDICIEELFKQMLKKAQDRYKLSCDAEKYENTLKFFEDTK